MLTRSSSLKLLFSVSVIAAFGCDTSDVVLPFGQDLNVAFTIQPTVETAATSWPVELSVFEGTNLLTTVDSGDVTLVISPGTGTAGALLTGASASVQAGVAAFPAVSIDRPGTGYVLDATVSGVIVATSDPFNVVSPTLAFVAQPSSTTLSIPMAPVSVAAVGESTFQGFVNIALSPASAATGANLVGTLSVAASGGIAEFTDLAVDRIGGGYTLDAKFNGTTLATSQSFAINPPQLVFTTQPSSAAPNQTLAPVEVTVQSGGATLTQFNGDVSVALDPSTGNSSATLSGTKTRAATNGVASFSNLRIDLAGTGYKLNASVSGQVLATSSAFDISGSAPLTYTPDLNQLQVASRQQPDYVAYDNLNIRAAGSGAQYSDPVTNVLVTKLTDATTPVNNASMSHGYSNGPLQISHPWGANNDMHTLRLYVPATGQSWLVDYRLGGTLSNWRQAPGGSPLGFTFSKVANTPQIAYYLNGTTLNRYNTATNSTENGGTFPASAQGSTWLQNDAFDEWFVTSDGTNVHAFNGLTGASMTRAGGSAFDEPYLEHGGQYVLFVRNVSPGATNTVWDLVNNVTTDYTNNVRTFHAASLFGYWTGEDVQSGGITVVHRLSGSDGSQTPFWGMGGYEPNYHDAGQWLQPNVPRTQQYYLKSTEDADHWGGSFVPGMLSLIRLDGADVRVVAHLYTNRNGNDNYWQSQSRATISPDGLLVMWTSDMNNSGGRADVFVAEVPRS